MAPAIKIDKARREVFVGDRRVFLSPKEFDLLVALETSKAIATRANLRRELKISGNGDRVVDQHVSRLRKKLKVPVVETVTLHGYKYIGR